MARPQIKVYLSLSDPYSDLTTSTWNDISAYVLLDDSPLGAAIQISRGRQNEQDAVQAGTCSLVLNNSDGRFALGSTTYGPPIALTHKIRVSAVWAGTERALFTGFTQDWNAVSDDYLGYSTIQVRCVDAFGLFARDETDVTLHTEVGFSYIRADHAWKQVLSAAFFPTANTWVDGSTIVGVVQPANYTATNVLQLLQQIAAVEDGTFFIEYDGFPTLHSRYYRLQVQTTPTVTFSDIPGEGYAPYVEALPRLNDQFLFNDVRVTSTTTGNTQQSVDGTSIIKNRRRKLDKGSVPLGDNDCSALASWSLYQYSAAYERFDSITTSGDLDNTLWPSLLQRLIDERIRIRKRDGSRLIQKDAWIAGIQHTISATGPWLTRWMLIPAEKGDLFFTLNSSASGVLDQNVLGY